MSYSCERLVLQDFNAYSWRTFRYTNASKQGWNDLIYLWSNHLPTSSRVVFAT